MPPPQDRGRPGALVRGPDAQGGHPALRTCRPVCPAPWQTALCAPGTAWPLHINPQGGDSQERILCSSRQCQFAWNGFSLRFLLGLAVPVSCPRGSGFWHLPSGPLMPHFLVPSPAPPSPPSWEPCYTKRDGPPGCSRARSTGCGGSCKPRFRGSGGSGCPRGRPGASWGAQSTAEAPPA